MAAVLLRWRAAARGTWRSGLVVAVLVGLAVGAVLGLATGARRTASAPDRYTAAIGGDPDLLLFQPLGPPLAPAVRELDGVASVEAITFVLAFLFGPEGEPVEEPNPFAGTDEAFGARLIEGRFTQPDAPDEFTVNRSAAALLGAEVGAVFDGASFSQQQTDLNEFGEGVAPAGPRFTARLVGVVASPADVDNPSPVITFSERFLDDHPDVGRVATIMALDLEPGVDPDAVLSAVQGLPGGGDVSQDTDRIVSGDVRRAVSFQATALWIVTAVAALVAAFVAGLLIARHVQAATADRRALRAIGYRPTDMTLEAVGQALAIAIVAWGVAIVVATAASTLFPIGLLNELEPDPGPMVDPAVVLFGGAGLVVTLAIVAFSTARRSRRRTAGAVRRGVVADAVADLGGGPPMVTGVRFAFTPHAGRGVPPVMLVSGIALSLAGLVGALVVGMSLVRVVDDPAQWGADYDQSFGNPFLPASRDIVTPVLADPDVEGLTAATVGSLSLEGLDVPTWGFEPIRGGVLPVIVAGRAANGPDEIALGRVVARRLGRGVGDTIEGRGPSGSSAALRVVGLSVTPDEVGGGAAMTYDGYAALVPDATRNLLLVRFRDGADAEAVERVAAASFTPPDITLTNLPTTVQALDRVMPAPFALAGVLALLTVIALAHSLVLSVRGRWRDLAVLRALGADRHQLGWTIHWQATAIALLGLVVGLSLGVVVGRRVFRLLADNVGVVPDPFSPTVVLIGVVFAVLLVANLVALGPGHRATHARAVTLLRDA